MAIRLLFPILLLLAAAGVAFAAGGGARPPRIRGRQSPGQAGKSTSGPGAGGVPRGSRGKDHGRGVSGGGIVLRDADGALPRPGEGPVYAFKPGVSVEEAVEGLRRRPEVAFAEPDYLHRAIYTPDDPGFVDQWGFQDTGQVIQGSPGVPDADIDVVEAWDLVSDLGNSPTVAVIDTGVDLDHPDLVNVLWTNAGETPGNWTDGDGNGYVDDSRGWNWAGTSNFYYNNPWHLGLDGDSQIYAQSITGRGCDLTSVGIMLSKAGAPTQPIDVSVRADLNGADLASAVIQPSEVSSTEQEVTKDHSGAVSLVEGNTYYLVVGTSQSDASNHYHLNDNRNTYDYCVGGCERGYDSSTSSWINHIEGDLYFHTNANRNPRDDNGHGTHCAGIVGAETDNSVGVAGTCPWVEIMPLGQGTAAGTWPPWKSWRPSTMRWTTGRTSSA